MTKENSMNLWYVYTVGTPRHKQCNLREHKFPWMKHYPTRVRCMLASSQDKDTWKIRPVRNLLHLPPALEA